MCIAKSCARTGATIQRKPDAVPAMHWPRAAKLFAAAASALLTACAGLPSFVPGNAGEEAGQQANAPAAPYVAAKSKRMRAMTARDILSEWGTFGLEAKLHKKSRARVPELASASASMELPDYSASIQEIVANATCRSCEQKPYHWMVLSASNLHGVPSGLIHAVIQKESGYNPGARSRKNARGLMQLTPDTARFVGVKNSRNLFDPQTNINAGTAYLKYLMRTHSTFEEVLAAYNSGPGNVRKYNGVPPFSETRRYVSDVKKFYAATSRNVQ
jgi:soluble lytic murein transglycosylase-like protein